MKQSAKILFILPAIILLFMPATGMGQPNRSESILMHQAKIFFGKLPPDMPGKEKDKSALVALGKMLYFEKGISVSKTKACNDCHRIDEKRGGVDNLPVSQGAAGTFGARNSPTTFNAGFQISQFRDGRSPDLADQAKGQTVNPAETGTPGLHPDSQKVADMLKEMKDYPRAFKRAFPREKEPISYDNAAYAIAAYQRTFITHDRFDQFMDGDENALTPAEKTGLEVIINQGCIRCHGGPLLGGMLYQKLGIAHPYKNENDLGRYEVTANEKDRYVFKVPMLRNIMLTAPYFHDGEVATLAEAVDLMAWMQLDTEPAAADIDVILRFFTALTDIERVTAAPPNEARKKTQWQAPSMSQIPETAEGELIRYGYEIVTKTYSYLGAGAKDPNMIYTGNVLSCGNCHQEGGTKQFGIPWVGVRQQYPQFCSRENRESDLKDRINSCMERSMNGNALSEDSREMNAIESYINWLSRDVPENLAGLNTLKLKNIPNYKADLKKGESLYLISCQACHGEDGAGYRPRSAGDNGVHAVPPLWGNNSYNKGAGMSRLLTAASFVRANMPLGTPWQRPMFTEEEAYHVAAYFNSFDRPVRENSEADYPDRTKKPIDCPYPPYSDEFSQEQHQYGPFRPISEFYKKKKK